MRVPVAIVFITSLVRAQSITPSVFSHNDYAQLNPFYGAYENRVAYIEADVFLKDDHLYVAHSQKEIKPERTLEVLYLNSLKSVIVMNKGWAYPDSTLQLKLMIDLKTEGISTLKKITSQLALFPELINASGFEIFISGNVPSPEQWIHFPPYIHFDGRPEINYTPDQLKRISLISISFWNYSKWDGSGELRNEDKIKLEQVIQSVHALHKKIRFWATPDLENVWSTLTQLQVDVIGTDNVPHLVSFLNR